MPTILSETICPLQNSLLIAVSFPKSEKIYIYELFDNQKEKYKRLKKGKISWLIKQSDTKEI